MAARNNTPREDGYVIFSDSPERGSGSSDGQPATNNVFQCSTEWSDSETGGDHCHTDLSTEMPQIDRVARKKLIIASVLCLLFTIGEAVGGVLAGSLAVATDSAHMLTDFASFMISLMAIYMASRRPTKKLSFGWHRAEIIGALVSVQFIWVVTGILVYLAVQRVIDDSYKIDAIPMMATAACAVAVNIALGLTLHGVGMHGHSHGGSHSHDSERASTKPLVSDESRRRSVDYGATADSAVQEQQKKRENINVRAAIIHVIGDLIQSLGVLTASIIIYFKPEWKLADPICTFLFSVLVLISTLNILKDAIRVLMEATPEHLEFGVVKEAIMRVEGVRDVHNLRLWSLTTTRCAASVHIALADYNQSQEIVKKVSRVFASKFGIQDSTIQVELYSRDMEDCDHCRDPVNH